VSQPTSGSTLSQEIIRYVEVNREKIDRFRYGVLVVRVVNSHIHICTWAEEERRGKEIDFLEGT